MLSGKILIDHPFGTDLQVFSSWSTSGRLLASGSDDQHLNVHKYQPETSTAPFTLDTTVATGHTANIFSVKFMPHSNDRTLVTAAGDFEVRVFDIEYSGRSSESSDAANRAEMLGGRHFRNLYKGVKYLSDGNTNARIYRSHADRVKRIVTESSPNLFLTCSEDGEVRHLQLSTEVKAETCYRCANSTSVCHRRHIHPQVVDVGSLPTESIMIIRMYPLP